MRIQVSLWAFAAFLQVVHCQDEWTEGDIADLKDEILTFFSEDSIRAAACLRYSFHSCTGGCDGCINLQDPDNGGLEKIYESYNALYDDLIPFSAEQLRMSRADFIALGGIVAVEYTIGLNNDECGGAANCDMNQPNFQFVYGREDCATAPDLPSDAFVGLPGGFLDNEGVMAFFSDAFGLDPTEATALLGAHTIGEMTRGGSGYTGEWKEGKEFLFNNEYYANMVSRTIEWSQFDAAEGDGTGDVKWQWKGISKIDGSEKSFMLPADISLVQSLEIEDDGGHSSCEFLECDYAPTTNLAEFFSNNQDVWLNVFTVAYDKMTSTVAEGAKKNLKRPTISKK